jgi:hypothetical protein
MQDYVVEKPLELVLEINDISRQINPFVEAKEFDKVEQLFRLYYEKMVEYEAELPEGKRFHKGAPLHNWGIFILFYVPFVFGHRGCLWFFGRAWLRSSV